jgi:hypothetical protein
VGTGPRRRLRGAIGLSLLAGALGANSAPHFVKGITREEFPTVFGSGPVVNLVAGWAGLVLTALTAYGAHVGEHPFWAITAGATGALAMGLFHARGLTFSRR